MGCQIHGINVFYSQILEVKMREGKDAKTTIIHTKPTPYLQLNACYYYLPIGFGLHSLYYDFSITVCNEPPCARCARPMHTLHTENKI
jgi:hypothetical protein